MPTWSCARCTTSLQVLSQGLTQPLWPVGVSARHRTPCHPSYCVLHSACGYGMQQARPPTACRTCQPL